MTTIFEERVTCAVCHAETKVSSVGSTNRMGSPDLDTRPPEMQRSTISSWVHECAQCGYCAYDLAFAPKGAAEVVRSEEYQRTRRDVSLPELARTFLCAARLLIASKEHARAFWACLHAAWACDDEGAKESAVASRLQAVEHSVRARAASQPILEQAGGEELVLTDVLRRAGRFDEAHAMFRVGIKRDPEALLKRLIAFEKELITRKDDACHTVAEAEGGA